MPRKTKEQKELEDKKTTKKSTTTKKTTAKKSPTTKTKKVDDKKVATKKPTKKTTTKKKTTTNTKKTAAKKTSTTKTKKVDDKKVATKKPTKKTTTKKKTATSRKKVEIVEYYDLPYRYNQTIVKVLAQTPNNLFIYWDISDKDRKSFEKKYGENFFENTRPILIVHNNTLGYSFEVEINDFANSWYLHVSDSKCDYKIELGRRPITKIENLDSNYIYITTSNEIESPNDKILFDKNQKMIYFKNLKTGQITRKSHKLYVIYEKY